MATAAPARLPPPAPPPSALQQRPAPLVRLLRPRQWLKNGFVLAPLVFARDLGSAVAWRGALLATLAFCCASSAVYIVNDLCDQRADRLHPLKRLRPLAAGEVTRPRAMALAAACAAVAAALALALPPAFAAILAAYAALMVAYSLGLKRLPIADLLIIAAGFVLRVLAGGAALAVPASHWILLCTFLLAAFLGCVKRKSELAAVGPGARAHRSALGGYSPALLDQICSVMLAASIMSYALYAVAPETVARIGGDQLIYTLPLVIYAMLRYLTLAGAQLELAGEPAAALLRDRPLLVSLALWLAAACLILYWPGRIHP